MRLVVLAMLAAASLGAHGEVRLQLQETDPAPPARLKTGDAFYARVLYASDRDIRIFGRPRGAESLPVRSHPSPVYPAGAGEALVWFAFDRPGAMQAMRIEAVAADGAGSLAVLEVPLQLEWTSAAPGRTPAAWVAPLNRDQQARVSAAPSPGSGDTWLTLFVHLMFLSVPAYLLAQGYALWRMRGRWNAAVWIPAIAMAAMYGWAILGVLAGSNIAPIVLVLTSPIALLYVIVLLLVDLRRRTN